MNLVLDADQNTLIVYMDEVLRRAIKEKCFQYSKDFLKEKIDVIEAESVDEMTYVNVLVNEIAKAFEISMQEYIET